MTSTITVPAPLTDGERLDQPEFHRRYAAMPETFWAELIDGKVCVMSPMYGPHGRLQLLVDCWLGVYIGSTPGVEGRPTPSTILDVKTELQPDAALFVLPEFGGRMEYDEHDCLEGAPELAMEISVTSESRDLGAKLREFEKAGVGEYVVILPRRDKVRWFRRVGSRFEEVEPEKKAFRSEQFPGLWLNPEAVLAGDTAAVLKTLKRGLRSAAHAAFVAKLQDHNSKKSYKK